MVRSGVAVLPPVESFFQFSHLALVACGYLALTASGFLDIPSAVLMAAALIVRLLHLVRIITYHVPARAVAFISTAYLAFYAMDYAWISNAFAATMHFVFFLAGLKVISAESNRDFFALKLIGFVELIGACLVSTNLNFFLFLALFLVLGVATFASAEIRRSSQARQIVLYRPRMRGINRRLTAASVIVATGILLLTGALFFVLPRTARAAFQHFAPSRFHVPGFADSVTLGQIGELKQSSAPVMHVRIDDPADHRALLHWRGAALSEFDGRRWFNPPADEEALRPEHGDLRLLENQERNRFAKRISYTVHLKDIASNVLFFAGRPEFIRIDAPVVLRSSNGNFRFLYSDPANVTYEAVAAIESPNPVGDENQLDPEPLSRQARHLNIRLPQIDHRVAELAERIAGSASSVSNQARAIEQYLRATYGYTLELPSTEPEDPIAYFLFDRRKGHCEYFASAMAVMLRTLGIPARVATGFGPGVYNPVSGWQIIRASDAHAWVEAYIPLRGWLTFDPTPPDPNPPQTGFWGRLRFYLDAADTFWQDWVLNYNLDRQITLASRVGESGERLRLNWFQGLGRTVGNWKSGFIVFARTYGVILVCVGVAIVLIVRFGKDVRAWLAAKVRVRKVSRGEAQASDATLLYGRMLKLLKNRGIEKPAWLTPLEFARVIPESELSLLVQDFTDAYNDLRFGADRTAAPRMMRVIDRLAHA